ncbi:hypothetical protein RMSM_04218 [Rhodopirellula maiorica SM1]|uniref:Uncharacterized protein n=1 Tax=Rhodopirellula maiorica SM1 TaxID=1265738 RepID=M5RHU2_9BACT|nr:hypothetical protein [Rhodopirellula maiorica]EMI18868.1 hypothetical protein RMSM_04218 [Rhodopirellula maiorica SM1]
MRFAIYHLPTPEIAMNFLQELGEFEVRTGSSEATCLVNRAGADRDDKASKSQ